MTLDAGGGTAWLIAGGMTGLFCVAWMIFMRLGAIDVDPKFRPVRRSDGARRVHRRTWLIATRDLGVSKATVVIRNAFNGLPIE